MKYIFRHKLFKNIFSLLILQGSNYLFPLITFPYLVRVLGVSNYGLIVTITAIAVFLNIIVDYGFNISATREISVNNKDKSKITSIYNKVLSIKLLLTTIVFFFYLIIILSFGHFNGAEIIFLLGFLNVIGNALFPIWFFQGIEKMKFITYLSIFSKLITLLLLIAFVNNQQDLALAVFIQSLNFLLPAIFAILLITFKFKIRFKPVINLSMLKREFNKGKYVFFTTLWINFYTNGPIIILGLFVGSYYTGIYGIGQRIQGAFAGLALPFSQAIYPHISALYEKDKNKFKSFQTKLLLCSSIGSVLIAGAIILFNDLLVLIAVGEPVEAISSLLIIFSLIVLLSINNTILARIQYAMNESKLLNKAYLYAAAIFLLTFFPLTYLYNAHGMAVSVILAEGTVLLINVFNVWKLLRHIS